MKVLNHIKLLLVLTMQLMNSIIMKTVAAEGRLLYLSVGG